MDEWINELIKDIAAKHGVAVGRDDPIMILHTANQRLLEENARAQQALLDQYKQELEALTARWNGAAKEDAERILNVALSASRNSIKEAANEIVGVIRTESDAALSRVAGAVQHARMVGILNVIAACITLLAMATAAWVALR